MRHQNGTHAGFPFRSPSLHHFCESQKSLHSQSASDAGSHPLGPRWHRPTLTHSSSSAHPRVRPFWCTSSQRRCLSAARVSSSVGTCLAGIAAAAVRSRSRSTSQDAARSRNACSSALSSWHPAIMSSSESLATIVRIGGSLRVGVPSLPRAAQAQKLVQARSPGALWSHFQLGAAVPSFDREARS